MLDLPEVIECGPDCWLDIVEISKDVDKKTIAIKVGPMVGDICLPFDVLEIPEGQTAETFARYVTDLFMERLLLDLSTEVVPEIRAKVQEYLTTN